MRKEIYELVNFYLTNYSTFSDYTLYEIRNSENIKNKSDLFVKLNTLLTTLKIEAPKSFATILKINDPILLQSYFSIVKRIVDTRTDRKISASNLAEAANISENSMNRIENFQELPTILSLESVMLQLDLKLSASKII